MGVIILATQEKDLSNTIKIVVLSVQLFVILTIGIILGVVLNQLNIALLIILTIFVICSFSYIVVRAESLSKTILSEHSMYALTVTGLVLTVFFSMIAYDISKRFSPLVVNDIKTQYIAIIKNEDNLFTLDGFSVSDMRSSLSGQFKELLIGSYYTKDVTEKIILETVLNQHKEIDTTRPILLNLLTEEIPISFKEKTSNHAKLMILFNPNNYSNILYFYAEDYTGNKEYILYVLSIDGDKIVCRPITSRQLNSRNILNDIYDNISFDTDLFWKNTKVRTFDEFQEYVVNRYKQLKQVVGD